MVHFLGLPQFRLFICCVQIFRQVYGIFCSLNWDKFVVGLKGDCLGLSRTDFETVLRTNFRIVQTEKSRLSKTGLVG